MNDHTLTGSPRLKVVRAADVKVSDVIQGTYRPGVTVDSALLPGERWSSSEGRVIALVRPFTATKPGVPTLQSGRRLGADEPVCVIRP